MSQTAQAGEIARPADIPRLLVDLPSRTGVFFSNVRDLLLPRRLPQLELRSAPAPFWPDVFVHRPLPWFSFLESGAYHIIALAVLLGIAHFLALHPLPVARSAFDHSQVIYYNASEYLPLLDTRRSANTMPAKADPVYAPQPIISVPPEADNHSQTIVTPPNVKLKQDVALPNMIAWSDKDTKPQLEIPPAPMTPAAEISRLAPRVETSVVTPPPDLQVSRSAPALTAPQPAVVAPPPTFDNAPARSLGEMNIAPSAVIAPAPQLPVTAQRAFAGGASASGLTAAPSVVPPPPSLAGAGTGASQSFGSRGRIIALSLHPAVNAPPTPPAGNRRGSFAAGPDGHPGASGTPGASSGTTAGTGIDGAKGNGTGSGGKGTTDLPSGLYVGNAGAKTSPVAGNGTTEIASAKPTPTAPAPRVTSTTAKPATPESTAKLSDAERSVFSGRQFYSMTLTMPNLNSAAGSWVIRFAEMNPEGNAHKADLSEPFATRKVDPGYPAQLMHENVAGTVILYAVIHADGTVGNIRVLRSVDDRLDRFATEAVSQWKFEPATRNGSPVDIEATFKIPFRPPKASF